MQANIFLLLFGAMQGFLLSIALLSKRERHSSHVFLTLFLVVVGLQLTFKVVTKVWLMENVRFFYILSYNLPFLVGPAVYLFIRSRTQEKSFNRSDIVHLVPFVFWFVVSMFAYFDFYGDYLVLNRAFVKGAIQLALLSGYYIASRKLIHSVKHESTVALYQFLNYVVLVEAIVIIALAIGVAYYLRVPDARLLFILLTVVIYWITWKLMTDPNALTKPAVITRTLEPQLVTRYAHSGLKEEEASRIESELRKVMSEQKLFTDSALTIDKVAASVNTSRHHLSQVLNERIHRPYNEYISELRLEEAQRRLADPKSLRYTIAAIALDAGFSTVSTFNEAFKKKYGVTPSSFRTESQKKMTA